MKTVRTDACTLIVLITRENWMQCQVRRVRDEESCKGDKEFPLHAFLYTVLVHIIYIYVYVYS